MDERELIQGCLSGDGRAWDAFIARFSSFLSQRLQGAARKRHLLLSSQDADEILSKIWEDLLRDDRRLLRRYHPGGSLDRWMLTVAMYRLRGWMAGRVQQEDREDARFREIKALRLARELPGEAPGADLERREQRERILTAIEKLPARDKLAVQAFYGLDWPHHRIARVLHLSTNEVGPLLLAARRRLEEFLRDIRNFCI